MKKVEKLFDRVAWLVVAFVLWRFLGPRGSADLAGVTGPAGIAGLPAGRPAVLEVSSHT